MVFNFMSSLTIEIKPMDVLTANTLVHPEFSKMIILNFATDMENKTSAWTNQTLVYMNCTCYLDPPCVADEFQPGRLGLILVAELAGYTLQHHAEAKERQSDVAEGRLHIAKR